VSRDEQQLPFVNNQAIRNPTEITTIKDHIQSDTKKITNKHKHSPTGTPCRYYKQTPVAKRTSRTQTTPELTTQPATKNQNHQQSPEKTSYSLEEAKVVTTRQKTGAAFRKRYVRVSIKSVRSLSNCGRPIHHFVPPLRGSDGLARACGIA